MEFIRNGALSYEEVMERRETFKPVYVTAKHCFGVVDREHDFIALETVTKYLFLQHLSRDFMLLPMTKKIWM